MPRTLAAVKRINFNYRALAVVKGVKLDLPIAARGKHSGHLIRIALEVQVQVQVFPLRVGTWGAEGAKYRFASVRTSCTGSNLFEKMLRTFTWTLDPFRRRGTCPQGLLSRKKMHFWNL